MDIVEADLTLVVQTEVTTVAVDPSTVTEVIVVPDVTTLNIQEGIEVGAVVDATTPVQTIVINEGPPGSNQTILAKDGRITVENGGDPNTILIGTTIPQIITSTGSPPSPVGITDGTLFFSYT